ncbi:MAG: SDR family oxidoreductase, partial [Betaproteobacteria bacterium]
KTSDPHPRLEGTIHSVAAEIEAEGGKALPMQVDVRDENAIAAAVAKTAETFGGIDILVNNASAISLTPTVETPAKRFDLMMAVNLRATFLCSQACIPHLKKASNPHILTLSPPLAMQPKWFAGHVAYTISKYGMSLCTLGMAEEFRRDGIAVNSLWPRTTIATAAVQVHFPAEILRASRHAAIMADAAHAILTSDARANTGNFYIDEDLLRSRGVQDFSRYAVTPGVPLFTDLFVE